MKVTLHGREINRFMTVVLEETCIKENIVKVVNAIRIIEEQREIWCRLGLGE